MMKNVASKSNSFRPEWLSFGHNILISLQSLLDPRFRERRLFRHIQNDHLHQQRWSKVQGSLRRRLWRHQAYFQRSLWSGVPGQAQGNPSAVRFEKDQQTKFNLEKPSRPGLCREGHYVLYRQSFRGVYVLQFWNKKTSLHGHGVRGGWRLCQFT